MKSALNICYVITENFLELTLTSIQSIIKFNQEHTDNLKFYIVSPDIKNVPSHLNLITLPMCNLSLTQMRIYIADLLDVERVIFLDSDTLVMTNIGVLWNVELNDNVIGAVKHQLLPTIGSMIKKYNLHNVFPQHVDCDRSLFNGGVMLIDCVKWKKQSMTEKLKHVYKQYQSCLCSRKNEPGLNVVLKDCWLELPGEWNYLPTTKEFKRPKILHYYGVYDGAKPRTELVSQRSW